LFFLPFLITREIPGETEYIEVPVPVYIPTDDRGGVIEFTRASFVKSWTGGVFTSFSIDFVFGKDIYEFNVNDITIVDNSGIGIIKGSLSRTDPGRYRLIITNVTKNGTINVVVEKENYIFTPNNRNVSVNSSTEYTPLP
jgi:hypothetical protein